MVSKEEIARSLPKCDESSHPEARIGKGTNSGIDKYVCSIVKLSSIAVLLIIGMIVVVSLMMSHLSIALKRYCQYQSAIIQ